MLPPPACPVRRLVWPAVIVTLACSDDPAGTEVSTCATLVALRAGEALTVVSSNNGTVGAGHDHTIVPSCP